VRLDQLQRRKRKDLAWYLAGTILVQLGLAAGIEWFWPGVRDPDFSDVERIVRARAAEHPGSPLVVVLGSSRTQMALAADRLNRTGDAAAPVVVNTAIAGGGPMMHQVVLRRLLKVGLRPQLAFVEIMPMSLSIREGAPIEERQRYQGRFTVAEVARLGKYFGERYRLYWPWLLARAWPSHRYQAELREALAIDSVAGQAGQPSFRDAYGWTGCPKAYSQAEIDAKTQENLASYAGALTQPTVAPGALRALRDTVQLCLDEHIAVVVLVPAEGSAFRSYAPSVEEAHMNAVRQLTSELAVPLVDARTWVDDDGFYDGHHVTQRGAEQYTERFAADALRPHLARLRAGVSPQAGLGDHLLSSDTKR
jgi:hypothetical protein